ncbi:hydroxymethylglutaryl-coenzyme A reductase-like protein [Elsinoe australis]|uniref:Hydroxymethylglutaryl-coenzyme A reductase-like protein n=1 Tax=Elsinoe australis TaxID=40998 RepID=A0A4U7BCS0_9PEZI|nr:hydroxymethylglutaryl-coenzyme A reductase-like protein [Elsinoe australis]
MNSLQLKEPASIVPPSPRKSAPAKKAGGKSAQSHHSKQAAGRERMVKALQLPERCPTILGKRAPQPIEHIKIENAIGFAQIPVGLAGPLTISGKNQQGTFFAPLATTEATLIASCSRGCKAFQARGGIRTAALREGMLRAPVFRFNTVDDAVAFAAVIPQYESFFRQVAKKTTRFGKLVSIRPNVIHKEVHVRFSYTCGDAGGQNMSTIATHAACTAFLKQFSAEHRITDFVLEGQMAGDKKLAILNVDDPRGVSVMAWGTIPDEVCRKVLGSPAARIHKTLTTGRAGATRVGMIGDTINTSNIVAAMFIACGQDAASVFEAGWTQLVSDVDEKTGDLTMSVYMPNLPVASIGGGTTYSTQKEALEMLGCAGKERKWALAETIAAFALALDISTMSAMTDDTFSNSHQKMARL